MEQEKSKRHAKRKGYTTKKAESIDGRFGGGFPRSSVESPVMGLEQRGERIWQIALHNF